MPENTLKILDRYPAHDQLLAAHGILPTQQRVQIAQILFDRAQHLSAEQILERVNHTHALVSKATVYNTLSLFARVGLIREVIIDPAKTFYDSNTEAHHHFYNVDTGHLEDIKAHSLGLSQLPTPPPGTRTEGIDIIIRVRNTA